MDYLEAVNPGPLGASLIKIHASIEPKSYPGDKVFQEAMVDLRKQSLAGTMGEWEKKWL